MAQYISYQTSLSTASTSENHPTKGITNAGVKRPALSVLNGNQQRKEKGICDASVFNNNQPVAKRDPEGLKFSIFEDDASESSKVVPKTPSLPKCVTQLITYDDAKPLDIAAKENKFSWSGDTPRGLSEKQKEYLEWSSPHLTDIYLYLRDAEKRHRPRPAYMSKQQDITLSMRSVLVDWLVEVGEEYKLHAETIHLAVSYTDRFLSHMSVLRGKLQLVGTACMFISSKYEEIYPPELREFVYITDDTYTKKQVLRMEHLVLKVLDFNVATPTAYTFLQIFCCMANASERISYLAQYICELSLLEADPFLTFLPSHIGAGCLALANYTLGEPIWSAEMVQLTGLTLLSFWEVIGSLFHRHAVIHTYPQQSITEKYRSPKLQCVADIRHQNKLIMPE